MERESKPCKHELVGHNPDGSSNCEICGYVFDPIVKFCIDGLKLSLQQNAMSREQAVDLIRGWYPEAIIDFDEI